MIARAMHLFAMTKWIHCRAKHLLMLVFVRNDEKFVCLLFAIVYYCQGIIITSIVKWL